VGSSPVAEESVNLNERAVPNAEKSGNTGKSYIANSKYSHNFKVALLYTAKRIRRDPKSDKPENDDYDDDDTEIGDYDEVQNSFDLV
jgi:hypothetical protein